MQIEITICHSEGLHARPAALFVQTASKYPCDITVRNVTRESQEVDAKSIMSVLLIGVIQGDRIAIKASGELAEQALSDLRTLIENNFEEPG
jgi:phosphotransferase system HPr (HPr) family protein